ncbi:MAG: hypothetical protein GY938_30275 [Ketobacter sp.]|nr:hypothetical protein [Ketobacter sp.]
MGFRAGLFKCSVVFTLLVISLFTPLRADSINKAETQAWNGFLSQHYLLALITDFERYQSGLGDPQQYDSLTQHLQGFRTHFDPLLLAGSSLPETQKQQLKQQWQQTARALSACLVTVQQGGFIDQEIRYQYQEGMLTLWQGLHEAVSSSSFQITPDMELILLLQQVNLRYLNPAWVLPATKLQSIAAIADDIDLRVQAAPEDLAALKEKWPLLNQALRNEHQSMSFIVHRYSGDLVTLLLQRLEAARF